MFYFVHVLCVRQTSGIGHGYRPQWGRRGLHPSDGVQLRACARLILPHNTSILTQKDGSVRAIIEPLNADDPAWLQMREGHAICAYEDAGWDATAEATIWEIFQGKYRD